MYNISLKNLQQKKKEEEKEKTITGYLIFDIFFSKKRK